MAKLLYTTPVVHFILHKTMLQPVFMYLLFIVMILVFD